MKAKNTNETVHNLVKLNLSRDQAKAYLYLIQNGSQSAHDLGKGIGVLPNAIYRLMRTLQDKGFITKLDTTPVKFQSVPPSQAITAHIENTRRNLEQSSLSIIKSLEHVQDSIAQTRIEITTGRAAMFAKFIELAGNAKQEILVISIGETVSDGIKLVTRDALERGVKAKYLFHVYNKENEAILKSWTRMGVEVRHSPGNGYHLMIFDGLLSFIVANNPEETAERTGMVFHSEGLTTAHREFFYSL